MFSTLNAYEVNEDDSKVVVTWNENQSFIWMWQISHIFQDLSKAMIVLLSWAMLKLLYKKIVCN